MDRYQVLNAQEAAIEIYGETEGQTRKKTIFKLVRSGKLKGYFSPDHRECYTQFGWVQEYKANEASKYSKQKVKPIIQPKKRKSPVRGNMNDMFDQLYQKTFKQQSV